MPAGLRRAGIAARVALATAVVGVALLAAAVPFGLSLRQARDAERDNQRAQRASTSAAVALALVVDLETGARGFILTGEPRFLEPRDRATRLLPRELHSLVSLTRDNAALAKPAAEFAARSNSYMRDYSDPQIALARRSRRAAIALVKAGEGKRRVDALRALSADLTRAIEAKAAQRHADGQASARRAVTLGLSGLFVALVMLLLLFVYLRRAIATPVASLTEGARRLEAGELATRVAVVGPPEFRDLAQTFNDMAATLQSSRGKLVGANAELAEARTQADAASRAKSEFLSRMSHELRTPLNSIIGFAQLLELEDLDDEARQSVGHIRGGGEHLLTLINEILDLAHVESGRLGISIEPVEVGAVVADALEMVRPLAQRRSIDLVGPRTVPPEPVRADQQRLRQILLNLLSNAIKYNREAGEVRVSVEREGERIVIAVADTGPGLSDEQLRLAFEPFERLGALHGDVEGTGLGLPLTKSMVEAMNGTLDPRCTVGEGSVFCVSLPVDRSAPVEEPAPDPAEVAGAEATAAAAVGTVLYVEDNSANVRLVERILARRPALRLLTAMHGRRGIELAAEHGPQLVLLDLHLPDMHGAEVLAELKRSDRTKDIPVIVVSADATERHVARLLAQGARAYLTKPLDVRELLHAVDAAVA
jgi:signal transduction histidine kinase/CheY-like chemotaxis protein